MITLNISDTLYKHLGTLARSQNITIETAMSKAISHEVQRYETSAFFAERRKRYNAAAFQAALHNISDTIPENNDQI